MRQTPKQPPAATRDNRVKDGLLVEMPVSTRERGILGTGERAMSANNRVMTVALHRAAGEGDKWFAETLLEKGANVNGQDESGVSALHLAAENGNAELVALLLSRGAEVNARTDGGWTPLHGAAAAGQWEVARLLLEKGADVNAADSRGETPLHAAVHWGRRGIAMLLMSNGADVEAGPEWLKSQPDLALASE